MSQPDQGMLRRAVPWYCSCTRVNVPGMDRLRCSAADLNVVQPIPVRCCDPGTLHNCQTSTRSVGCVALQVLPSRVQCLLQLPSLSAPHPLCPQASPQRAPLTRMAHSSRHQPSWTPLATWHLQLAPAGSPPHQAQGIHRRHHLLLLSPHSRQHLLPLPPSHHAMCPAPPIIPHQPLAADRPVAQASKSLCSCMMLAAGLLTLQAHKPRQAHVPWSSQVHRSQTIQSVQTVILLLQDQSP